MMRLLIVVVVVIVVFWWCTVDSPVRAQDKPVAATVTELERLQIVNTWQAAIIAQVDAQAAEARKNRAREAWNTVNTKVKDVHKWDAATTFEINAETGEVLVHLPPTKADAHDKKKPPTAIDPNGISQSPAQGKKEQH